MEAVKQRQDVEIEAEEVEEAVSLHKKRFRQNSNPAKTHEDCRPEQPLNLAQSFDVTEDTRLSYEPSGMESPNLGVSEIVTMHKIEPEKLDTLCVDDKTLPLEHGRVESRKEIEKEAGELYLERVYDKQGSHNFYCPNCNSCITKVIVRDREWDSKFVSDQSSDTFRCTSCFSFLVPIGNWFLPKSASPVEQDPSDQDFSLTGESVEKETMISIAGVGTVAQLQDSMEIQYDQSESNTMEPSSHQKAGVHTTASKDPTQVKISTVAPLEKAIIGAEKEDGDTSTDNKDVSEQKGPISIAIITGTTETTTSVEPSRDSKRWQILKSVVYGGLAESITSLGIVTSAASANAKTPNIVVLGLANLIGGLFVIGHNLRDLKLDRFKRSKNDTEERQLDRYEEALGEREHMVLHFSIVILSFLVFGLIPPLVYGLSFRESDSRDFKMAAVAGASLLCISLLALGKAHIQKPSRGQKYITVVIYYLGIGIGVSGLSYLAGDLIGKLFDKLGWLKSSSEAVVRFLPRKDFLEPGFGSF